MSEYLRYPTVPEYGRNPVTNYTSYPTTLVYTRAPGAVAFSASPTPFSAVPGCVLWFRADLGLLSSGGLVYAWGDQSLRGRNAIQATAADQPGITASSLNSKPGVKFTRANTEQMAVNHHLVHGAPSASFFIAMKLSGAAYNSNYRLFGTTGTNSIHIFQSTFGQVSAGFPDLQLSDGTTTRACRGPTNRSGSSAGVVFDVRATSGDMQAWDNGTAGPNVATAWSGNISSPAAVKLIGDVYGSTTFLPSGTNFDGDILEIGIATPALSVDWHTKIRADWMARYGL